MKRTLIIITILLGMAASAYASTINGNMRGKNSDGNWVDLSVDSNGNVKIIGV